MHSRRPAGFTNIRPRAQKLLPLLLLLVLALAVVARDQPAAAPDKPPTITVKLVTDFASSKPVSDLESLQPVKTTVFNRGDSHEVTLGERCTLWVRNAHIDGKFFFERYYQDKYIGRNAVLDIDPQQLGVGEHVLQPGNHRFTLGADGRLSSDDPNIRVAGSTLLLKLHPVTVYAVDAGRTGPAEFRLLPADIGLLSLDPDVKLSPQALPDPRLTHDPRTPTPKGAKQPVLTNVLSHQKQFYPLTVWLPANQIGQGYVLYPSWQAFHLRPDGAIDLEGGKAPRVAGVQVQGKDILLPYRKFSGESAQPRA